MGEIEYSTAEDELTVLNSGDINADAIVRFYAPAVRRTLENLTTGEKIEVNAEH